MAQQSRSEGRKASIPAIALVGLGVFLLTIAVALVFFVVPAQKKTPLDINSTTITETTPGAVLVAGALARTRTQTPRRRLKKRPRLRKTRPSSRSAASSTTTSRSTRSVA